MNEMSHSVYGVVNILSPTSVARLGKGDAQTKTFSGFVAGFLLDFLSHLI